MKALKWLQLIFAYNSQLDPSYRVELSHFHIASLSLSLSLCLVISLILLLFISLSLRMSIWENSIQNSALVRGKGGGEPLSSRIKLEDG